MTSHRLQIGLLARFLTGEKATGMVFGNDRLGIVGPGHSITVIESRDATGKLTCKRGLFWCQFDVPIGDKTIQIDGIPKREADKWLDLLVQWQKPTREITCRTLNEALEQAQKIIDSTYDGSRYVGVRKHAATRDALRAILDIEKSFPWSWAAGSQERETLVDLNATLAKLGRLRKRSNQRYIERQLERHMALFDVNRRPTLTSNRRPTLTRGCGAICAS